MSEQVIGIPGVRVGHWTDVDAATGCTVILCPAGAVAGVDVRGSAPGTREVALLDPVCMVDKVHAICLAGGSAYGLAAADGVMQWLEEQGHGFDVFVAKVPIVPTAILFDLALGNAQVRPTAAAGYAACQAATDGPVAEGNVGAGTGATVGKLLGFPLAMKGGLGVARRIVGDKIIAAVVAVNAAGNIVNPATGQIVAGARHPSGKGFVSTPEILARRLGEDVYTWSARSNTTLGVIITNVALTKVGCTKVAQMAHDGLARAIQPVHTTTDGDIVFALSHGEQAGDLGMVGAIAAEVMAAAIVRAAEAAERLHGVPAKRDWVIG
ncbi:MAG: P1 family peptidase [Caldilineaceae bacterium]